MEESSRIVKENCRFMDKNSIFLSSVFLPNYLNYWILLSNFLYNITSIYSNFQLQVVLHNAEYKYLPLIL